MPAVASKFFKNYSELPPELRMMIVDEMETADRCRFSGCSKLTDKEAKDCKNYMYGLKLQISGNQIYFEVHYNNDQGFTLSFKQNLNKKYVKCTRLGDNEELWTFPFGQGTDLIQYAFLNFKNVLQSYQSIIKTLNIYINTSQLTHVDFEAKDFYNLKDLQLNANTDIRAFLSRTRNPLANLVFHGHTYDHLLNNCTKVYQVQTVLNASHAQFSSEELLRLSASSVTIGIGNLTEKDIFNFVKAWQSGKIEIKVKRYEWNLLRSQFNVKQLFPLFGEEYDEHTRNIKIRHDKETGKTARLFTFSHSLVFYH